MLRLFAFTNKNQLLFIQTLDFYHFYFNLIQRCLSSSKCDRSSEDSCDNPSNGNSNIPEPPTNCCLSGCPNCVWVEYAEKLSKMFRDGGAKSREIIMSKVTDENMKAFLSMELRLLEKRLKDEETNDGKFNGNKPK